MLACLLKWTLIIFLFRLALNHDPPNFCLPRGCYYGVHHHAHLSDTVSMTRFQNLKESIPLLEYYLDHLVRDQDPGLEEALEMTS
jgi:hypothetical protein